MQDLQQAASANPAVFATTMIKNILSAPDDIKNFSDNFKKSHQVSIRLKRQKALKMLKSQRKKLLKRKLIKKPKKRLLWI